MDAFLIANTTVKVESVGCDISRRQVQQVVRGVKFMHGNTHLFWSVVLSVPHSPWLAERRNKFVFSPHSCGMNCSHFNRDFSQESLCSQRLLPTFFQTHPTLLKKSGKQSKNFASNFAFCRRANWTVLHKLQWKSALLPLLNLYQCDRKQRSLVLMAKITK